MSETGIKLVDGDLASPFIPWAALKTTYSIGDTFEAQGLAGIGFPDVEITDPANAFRGILVFPSIDDWFVQTTIPGAVGNWNRPAVPGDPYADPPQDPIPFRYLSVAYDSADVLGVGGTNAALSPGALSVASITVTEEVTP